MRALVAIQTVAVAESLGAQFALEGLLSRVHPAMARQSALPSEPFSALVTSKRFLLRVDATVAKPIRLHGESLVAERTDERFVRVHALVRLEAILALEFSVAHIAFKCFRRGMDEHMSPQS